MILSPQEIAELAERARPIYERLAGARGRVDRESGEPVADAEIERWCQATTRGDWQTFEKRLRWDGIDLPNVRRGLRGNAHEFPGGTAAPAWSETLNEILAAVAAYADEASRAQRPAPCRFLDARHPCPFEDVFVPVVLHAARNVAARAGASYAVFTSNAHGITERALLGNLAHVCGRVFLAEFTAFRALRTVDGNALYREFVATLLRGHLATLFSEYSVLGRLVAIIVRSWVDATTELLVRVDADHAEIRAGFSVTDELGQVVALTPELSDPHNGRRFVVALKFACGLKVMYKPRDLRLELAFQRLLDWMNARGLAPAMRTLRVIARSQYGWVEFVEQAPCEGEDAARAYYARMGTLLCLGYAFEGVDLHNENIMTSGADPIVVDAETFFYPKPRKAGESAVGTQALTIAHGQVRNSVLKTGMLPETRIADGVCFDVSALGDAMQVMPGRAMEWRDANVDTMRYEMVSPAQPAKALAPPATQYIDDLVKGFEQTYRFLLTHRDALIADSGPLRVFMDLPVRFIVRPTRVYGVLLQNGFHPRNLHNGIDRSIALDALSVGYLRASDQPPMWPVVQAEHRALEQLDIPRFTTTTDGTWLATGSGERIDDCFAETGYARALAGLRAIEPEDMYRQISFIRGAFLARNSTGHDAGNGSRADAVAATDGSDLTAELALQECRAIATTLDALAIRSDDGTASWIGLCAVLATGKASVRLLDMGLFDGVCGIAIFLSAFAKISGDAKYRDLARAAIAPLQFTLRDPQFRERASKRIGIGGGFGVGSVIYSLVTLASLLDESELIEDAAHAAAYLASTHVEEDQALDVLMGSAGAMLGLLKLHHANRDVGVLEQARAYARHLLSRQCQNGEQRGGWPGVDTLPLSSFSHGAAGIAHALMKLHELTGEAHLLRAAGAAVEFERTLFVPEVRNWARSAAPAERVPKAVRATWCQGAPGIALSRLGMLDTTTVGHVREDLDVALETTGAQAVGGVDHLCCGNFGRAEVLFTAGGRLARPELQHTALRNAGRIVSRARRVGAWGIDEQGGPHRNAFFQGRAGIGYTLLRLTHPDVLPSVLMWQ